MPLLEIDRERCHQDGICAEICPAQIITLDKATDYPALVPGGDDRCIRCGHCVAVCPHGALNHAAMAAWIKGHRQTLVLDASDLTYISSKGVRALRCLLLGGGRDGGEEGEAEGGQGCCAHAGISLRVAVARG